MRRWVCAALALAVVACGKSEQEGGGGAKGTSSRTRERSIVPASPKAFAAFDPAGLRRAWQGVWVVPNQMRMEVWEVSGDVLVTGYWTTISVAVKASCTRATGASEDPERGVSSTVSAVSVWQHESPSIPMTTK